MQVEATGFIGYLGRAEWLHSMLSRYPRIMAILFPVIKSGSLDSEML